MNIIIDGKAHQAQAGESILVACANAGINIPTLCYSKSIGVIGSCRVCVVQVKGYRNLVTACNTPVCEGMEISTNTTRVLDARKTVLELLLSDHRLDCLKCVRSSDCRLKRASENAGCNAERFTRNKKFTENDEGNSYIRRNNDKCILCGRCVRVCKNTQEVSVLAVNGRGFDSYIGCAWGKPLETVPCISCGQCLVNCPTAALVEVDRLDLLKQKLNDPDIKVVIATAPSTRVAIGEGFGFEAGKDCTGKMVSALKKLGFHRVFDLNLAADFTIMEEATEFLKRLGARDTFSMPMLTSCCPGWINYVRMYYPNLLGNVSTTKSPQQILGALVKSYYAEKANLNPKKIFTVMLMPCVAKQSEADRIGDVDMTMTVTQAIRLIKEYNIDFASLRDSNFDDPLGMSSGAGLIFGTTGGVMEASLRTLSEKILNKRLDNIDFHNVRGERGIKVASIPELRDPEGNPINVAVVSGMANAEKILKKITCVKDDSGVQWECDKFHFIEIMACLGGCVNGGGMPVHNAHIQNNFANSMKRASTLYHMDQYNNLRRAHENPTVKQVYDEYLGEQGSELAHKLLHTHYKKKEKYNK